MKNKINNYSSSPYSDYWILIPLLAIIYYITGWLGQLAALSPGHVSPLWPPSGIALAAVLIFGYPILPGIFLGSFFNALFVFSLNFDFHSILVSACVGCGATLQAFVGAFLIKRYTHSKPLDTTTNVFKFIAISLMSCLINATIGSLSLSLSKQIVFLENWWTWWVGDTTGILVFAPFVLSWYSPPFSSLIKWKWGEAILLGMIIFLFMNIIFNNSFDLTYLLIPFIVWVGFRFQQKGITLAVVLIATLTMIETIQGKGPFFVPDSLNKSLLLLELFFSILSSTGLLLVISLQERQQARNLLELYNLDLESKVKERTIELQEQLEQIKKMQQQIITQEKLASLGTLVAGVAHEIKNPLNFIGNFSELSLNLIEQILDELKFQKEDIPQEKYQELTENVEVLSLNINKVIEHTKRANETIQRMLSHAKEKPKEFEETDLNALIQEYCKLLYYSKKQKNPSLNVQIKQNLDSTLSPIFANKQDLGRMILNLLDNAFNAMEEKKQQLGESYEPSLIVTTKELQDKIQIKIYDNGKGIPKEYQNKIFNAFFTERESGEGTGLGLSISYNIIAKEHNGTIEFESKEGEFTEFTIHLPKRLSNDLF